MPHAQMAAMGKVLRVGTQTWAPFVMVSNATGRPVFTGLCVDLLDIVAQEMNFSYELVLPTDGEWGDKRGENWTGVMGLLERQEVDLTNAPLTMSWERGELADYSLPFQYTFSTVAVRTMSRDRIQWRAFLDPLQCNVYLCALCALLCCTCILYAIVTCQHTLLRHPNPMSFVDVVEFLFGSLLREAMPHVWRGGTSRVFIASWCMLGLVLASSYTGKLTSLLVDMTPPPPFTSLAEMVTRDDFRWGTIGGSITPLRLRSSKDQAKQAAFRGIQSFEKDDPEVLSADPEVHKRKVLSEDYAFIGDVITVRQWADSTSYCDIAVMDESLFGLEYFVFFTPKTSPLTKDISDVFLRLHDSGVLSHLQDTWFPSRPDNCRDRPPPTFVTMATLQGPCYVTVAGIFAASGVLFLERFLKRLKRHLC